MRINSAQGCIRGGIWLLDPLGGKAWLDRSPLPSHIPYSQLLQLIRHGDMHPFQWAIGNFLGFSPRTTFEFVKSNHCNNFCSFPTPRKQFHKFRHESILHNQVFVCLIIINRMQQCNVQMLFWWCLQNPSSFINFMFQTHSDLI